MLKSLVGGTVATVRAGIELPLRLERGLRRSTPSVTEVRERAGRVVEQVVALLELPLALDAYVRETRDLVESVRARLAAVEARAANAETELARLNEQIAELIRMSAATERRRSARMGSLFRRAAPESG
jgi:hypothetical protein